MVETASYPRRPSGRFDAVPEAGENVNPVPSPSYDYSRSHRAVEILSITAGFLLLVGFGVQVWRTISTPSGVINLLLTGLCAYVAADLVSGIVHWAGDTIGDEQVPFLGPNFIKPFRNHHVDQLAITRHDFIETNGNNCIIVIPPLTLALILLPGKESFLFFACTFMAFLGLFVVATNQFHKWAHQPNPAGYIRRLQSWGLILSPRHHDIHHAPPHDKHYCITVGWLNPILNGMRFFRAAEWVVAQFRPGWLHIDERKRVLADLATGPRMAVETGADKQSVIP